MIVDFSSVSVIIEFSLIFVLSILQISFIWFFSRKYSLTLAFGVISLGTICSYVFVLSSLFIIFVCLGILFEIIYCFCNLSNYRVLFSNSSNRKKNFNLLKKSAIGSSNEKIYDSKALYAVIDGTVQTLSKTKTGAIITFQKKDDLKQFMKNGVMLGDCPITKELLITIFYPGTRLHDGAVIIKNGKLIAAAVYYSLTTRPLSGKFGSRHRAAIGISESSDSITVVVSEETGRISIAQNGDISSVSNESFLNVFSMVMDQE